MNADDYPSVKFWYKDQRNEEEERRKKYDEEHNIRRPKGRASKENVRFWFLENEDGTIVPRPIVDRLRMEAKAIWEKMSQKYSSMGLPWSSVLPERQLEFWIRLEREFPLLRLCAHHYKANMVATSDYTHWYKRRFPVTSGTSNSAAGLSASPSSGGTRKRRRSSNPIGSRKSTWRRTASRQVEQVPTDDENEEEVEEDEADDDEDDNYECEDDEINYDDKEEKVEKVVEPEIISDSKDANEDDSASMWDALEKDIQQVSQPRLITFYHNTIHRYARTT